jgi:hypothetical protein
MKKSIQASPESGSEEDQAKEWQRQIDDFEHAGCLPAALELVNLSAGERKSGLAKLRRSPYRRGKPGVMLGSGKLGRP